MVSVVVDTVVASTTAVFGLEPDTGHARVH